MKFEIKSYFSGGVLFSLETDSLKLTLEAAVKRGADLQGADLQGADLQSAYLRGADLRGADLQSADLQSAYLRGADLQGADLQGADLQGADLQGADLRGAYLRGAYLRGADLQGADLRGADLQGADLQGADLQGADLERFPTQIIGHKHSMWTTQDGKLRVGCHTHTFDEWREIADKLGASEGYDAIDVEIYKLHIEHLARISQLLWNKKKADEK